MEDDYAEPFNGVRESDNILGLEIAIIDKEKTLLSPDENNPEILAFLNPSVYPEIHIDTKKKICGYPMTIRVIKKAYNTRGESSEIHLAFIDPNDPFKIHYNKQMLLGQDDKFSQNGIEDTRITQIPRDKLPDKIRNEFTKEKIYALTSVAFDGRNPRIRLDLTENFEKVIPFGIIGPQIPYKKAIAYLPEEFGYRDCAKLRLSEKLKSNPLLTDSDFLITDKDAALEFNYGRNEWNLWHRIEPHIQIAKAKNIEDFLEETYWTNQLKNITYSTVLRAGSGTWNSEKIGLGGPPILINGKYIAHYHGVERKEEDNITKFFYTSSLFEYDPRIGQIVSAQRHNYLIPSMEKGDTLFGKNEKKYIMFSMGILKDPTDKNTVIFYSGVGDTKLNVKSANIPWAFSVLTKQSNRISP